MKLTKDHFIEGQVICKGTHITLSEASYPKSVKGQNTAIDWLYNKAIKSESQGKFGFKGKLPSRMVTELFKSTDDDHRGEYEVNNILYDYHFTSNGYGHIDIIFSFKWQSEEDYQRVKTNWKTMRKGDR